MSGYATKATTLAGYGITDAKIQNGTITLGSNTITPLTSFTETDPTVPSWAKASTKPTYTASEVGAISTSHAANGITTAKINAWDAKSDFSGSYNDLTDKPTIPTVPTNISAFTNDSGYLTSYTETDPTVPSWAKASSKPSYGLTEISGTDDLRAIEALTGTSGLLKKTAANTWTLDTNTYLTSYTDEKVKQTPLNGENSIKGLLFSSSVGRTETTNTIYTSNKLQWNDNSCSLYIYNADGTKQGWLQYNTLSLSNSSTAYSGRLIIADVTASRVYTLPDKTGTVALTSDIPSVYSSTNTGGYLTMATLPIYDGTVE